jgi:hypothetical protein
VKVGITSLISYCSEGTIGHGRTTAKSAQSPSKSILKKFVHKEGVIEYFELKILGGVVRTIHREVKLWRRTCCKVCRG